MIREKSREIVYFVTKPNNTIMQYWQWQNKSCDGTPEKANCPSMSGDPTMKSDICQKYRITQSKANVVQVTSAFGARPQSHCSPSSTIPFPHCALTYVSGTLSRQMPRP